jgi:hypothetical protein
MKGVERVYTVVVTVVVVFVAVYNVVREILG